MTITNLNAPSPEEIVVPPAPASSPAPTPTPAPEKTPARSPEKTPAPALTPGPGPTPAPVSTLVEQKNNPMNKSCGQIINCKEAKNQVLFSVPMIVVNGCFYFISLVSVMFAGHLGKLELASSNLANSWAMVTGFSFMVGLSGALETLCGQGYGAKMFRMLGIHLQTSSIISFFFSVVVSVIWWYSDRILILLHQEPAIAHEAGVFLKFLIPGLFAYAFLQNIVRFLQAQSIILPLACIAVAALVLHIGIAYALVHWTHLGFKGAALAVSISFWITFIALSLYVLFSKKFSHIRPEGLSSEPLQHILSNLKLALPSAGMVCLEYWAFEILVLLAGLMPNAETTTSVVAMCVNTETIAYMISYGLSAAASTRVSNEIGAGNIRKAKQAMAVTLKLAIVAALIVDLALGFGHNAWAGLFSDEAEIIRKFASMTPLLLVSFLFDFIQGILSGVARGCGWQRFAMCINLASFYFVGMTIGAILAFKFNKGYKGLWVGLISGLACQSTSLLLLTFFIKWGKEDQVSKDTNNENESQP
ncbi:protein DETOXIFICATION 18-like [Solanum pennellii]|uniref:Protein DETOXIFICATION n=1 Tax=Solanum pennellii TaxID=28526 RepID=A0ABM1HSJ3_SOLPN|nr:protein DETOXIFICATION 18-like [Solanum pennellii]